MPIRPTATIAASLLLAAGCSYVPTAPSANILSDGVAVTISGGLGSLKYYSISVPTGAAGLRVRISGGTGDADLYLRQGARPTPDLNDCESEEEGNVEECFFSNPPAGSWHVAVVGFEAYSGLELLAEIVSPPAVAVRR